MIVSATTHRSTVRTTVLSTAALTLALFASAGLSVSALWVAPLVAVAAVFTKLVIDQTFPHGQMAAELAIAGPTPAAHSDVFI